MHPGRLPIFVGMSDEIVHPGDGPCWWDGTNYVDVGGGDQYLFYFVLVLAGSVFLPAHLFLFLCFGFVFFQV